MSTLPFSNISELITPDAVVIYHSRGKLFLLTLGAAGFVMAGIWFVQLPELEPRVVGTASILFFGACFLYGLIRLLRRTPAIIIHPLGIFENGSGLSAGFLRWDEISGMFLASMRRQRFLAFVIKDVETFLARQSRWKAKLMRMNVQLVGAAVTVAESALPMKLEELVAHIEQKRPGLFIQDRGAQPAFHR